MENSDHTKIVSHIRETIWTGKFFVKIEVPEHYISGTEQPKPVFKELNRNTYLEFYYDSINELVKAYTIGSELWFGFRDKPLHWHVPFGVLVDANHGINPKKPLEMTAHYRTPPFDKIISNNVKLSDIPGTSFPLTGLRTAKDHYKHSVKEAAQIRFGSTNVIMLNTKADEWDQLFDVLKGNYMEKFERIFNKIWFNSDLKIRAMPLRVYVKDYENMIQKSVPLVDEEGKDALLGDSLKKIFPNIKFHWDENVEGDTKQYQVISHGILLDYDYTLSFLSETFYALDGFVYLSFYKECRGIGARLNQMFVLNYLKNK